MNDDNKISGAMGLDTHNIEITKSEGGDVVVDLYEVDSKDFTPLEDTRVRLSMTQYQAEDLAILLFNVKNQYKQGINYRRIVEEEAERIGIKGK